MAAPGHVAVPLCESDRVSTTRSSCSWRPNSLGGGTATLGQQDPTRSCRWARRPAVRGARPPPTLRRLRPSAPAQPARCPAFRCPADHPCRPRLAGEWTSTSTCRRSSSGCSPTTSWRSIIVYYQEVPRRVRAAGGFRAVASAIRLLCGCPRSGNQARRAQLGRVGRTECGGPGGPGARA